MSLILGAHMSIANGFLVAAQKTIEEYQANAMQIFLKSPRGRAEKPLDPAEAKACKEYCTQHKIFVVGHCSYLLNFAKKLRGNDWALASLISDLNKIHQLGGQGIVLHIGRFQELDPQLAAQNVIDNLRVVLEKTKTSGAQIFLENTSGQGSEMGRTFEELADLYQGLKKPKRVKFCLDLAHAYAAGYDIKNPKTFAQVMKQFDELIGLEKLGCFHFNDSKKPLNSRVDRHENIGKGTLGKNGMQHIAKFAVSHSIPMILETPPEGDAHKRDLKVIRAFV